MRWPRRNAVRRAEAESLRRAHLRLGVPRRRGSVCVRLENPPPPPAGRRYCERPKAWVRGGNAAGAQASTVPTPLNLRMRLERYPPKLGGLRLFADVRAPPTPQTSETSKKRTTTLLYKWANRSSNRRWLHRNLSASWRPWEIVHKLRC